MEHREAVLESLSGGCPPVQVLISHELLESSPEKWTSLAESSPADWYALPAARLSKLGSLKTTSGLWGIYEAKEEPLESLLDAKGILVCWEVQDPGNIGTILRSCRAFGPVSLILVGGCSPWSAKVARASAGAILHVPLHRCSIENGEDVLKELKNGGFDLYSASPREGPHPSTVDWTRKSAIILGNESRGMPMRVQKLTKLITIPMGPNSESLNVAVTGSILCYERLRGDFGSTS